MGATCGIFENELLSMTSVKVPTIRAATIEKKTMYAFFLFFVCLMSSYSTGKVEIDP